MGWSFIFFLVQNLLTHISLLIFGSMRDFKKKITEKCKERRAKKKAYQQKAATEITCKTNAFNAAKPA